MPTPPESGARGGSAVVPAVILLVACLFLVPGYFLLHESAASRAQRHEDATATVKRVIESDLPHTQVDVEFGGPNLFGREAARIRLLPHEDDQVVSGLVLSDENDPVSPRVSVSSVAAAMKEAPLHRVLFPAYDVSVDARPLLDAVQRCRIRILQERARGYGESDPCPEGWSERCAQEWRARTFGRPALSPFVPFEVPSQLQVVNARQPRAPACGPLPADAVGDWPDLSGADPERVFDRKLRSDASTREGWVMLSIDPETVEAALQLSLREGKVDSNEVEPLRAAARRTLFRRGARTVLALPTVEGREWQLREQEPYLISEQHDMGQLIHVSTAAAGALRAHDLLVMQFEDRVCPEDQSYSIAFSVASPVVRSQPRNNPLAQVLLGNEAVRAWEGGELRFQFGANGNAQGLLETALEAKYPLTEETGVVPAADPPSPAQPRMIRSILSGITTDVLASIILRAFSL